LGVHFSDRHHHAFGHNTEGVFEDEDGDFYIIAGVFEYYVTKLNTDMVSLAETPKHITFTNHVYGPCGDGKTDDKPFLHKNNGIYYLSWGCFYATSSSVYGPYTMRGAVINTTLIAPAFRMNDTAVYADGEDEQQLVAARIASRTTDIGFAAPPSAANAGAANAARTGATPTIGDKIELHKCSTADPTTIKWDAIPEASTTGLDGVSPPFAIALHSDPTLCIEVNPQSVGTQLQLQKCQTDIASSAYALQHFLVKSFDRNGSDVGLAFGSSSACPCWNVQDNNARAPGDRGVNGASVQCFTCVDGGSDGFNPNQRFDFTAMSASISSSSGGVVRTWAGYSKDFCVAVGGSAPAPPPPPPPKPWFLKEDYTDRHGSFLPHGGQWYFASNDRSHSLALNARDAYAYRDTVMCYIHFKVDGTMAPCIVNAQGVGTHSASFENGMVEAEEYGNIVGGAAKLDLTGMAVARSASSVAFGVRVPVGAAVHYPRITDLKPGATLHVQLATVGGVLPASTGASTATLVVTAGAGRALDAVQCSLPPPSTNASASDFAWVACGPLTGFDQRAALLELVFTLVPDGDGSGSDSGSVAIIMDRFELRQ
jgi:hypothetical protein